MQRLAHSIAHARNPHPTEITLKSGAPNYARYAGPGEFKRADGRIRQTRRNDLRRIRLRRGGFGPSARNVFVDMAFDIGGGLISKAEVLLQIVGEGEMANMVKVHEPPQQYDTFGAEELKAYRMDGPKQRSRRNPARRLNQLLSRHVEESTPHEPDQDVVTAVAPRQASGPTGSKENGLSRSRQVLGYLATRLAASDHQHRPTLEIDRAAVIRSIDLVKTARQRRSPMRPHGTIQVTACDHHVARSNRAAWGGYAVRAVLLFDGSHRGVPLDREAVPLGEFLEERNERVAR
jgi:hypothetical protein